MESSYTLADLLKRAFRREDEPYVTPLDPSQWVPFVLKYLSIKSLEPL